jgi:hypothetical protein
VARDGTSWHLIEDGSECSGRKQSQNVIPETPGPTSYARCRIKQDAVVTAFRLIVDDGMLRFIQKCTNAEGQLQTGDKQWAFTLEELDAFIALLYVRGACGSKGLSLKGLWSGVWGIPL